MFVKPADSKDAYTHLLGAPTLALEYISSPFDSAQVFKARSASTLFGYVLLCVMALGLFLLH